MSNFRQWTREKLLKRFGLTRVYKHPILEAWLDNDTEVSDLEKTILGLWHQNLEKFVDYWNEEEVKLKFIGNVISLVNFDTQNLSAFAERELKGAVDGEELSGNPDIMVAKGKQEVDAPFFLLHIAPHSPKGKQEIVSPLWGDESGASPDPAGQCLVAMLLAYEKNKEETKLAQQAMYGVYVIGRNWFFVILKDKEYSISLAYDSTRMEHLLDIVKILKTSRAKIKEIWGE